VTDLRLFGRCTKGLEGVLASEIQQRLDGQVTNVSHRQVTFSIEAGATQADLGRATELRCADDVFLDFGVVEGVSRERASLATLASGLSRLNLGEALQHITSVRDATPASFDVVCSFMGQRNYNRFEAEKMVAGEICRQIHLPRVDTERRRDADLSWRIHVDGTQASVGLRIARQPLHRRSYRTDAMPGALHPPVAAAMVLLAEPRSGALILDPSCGSGTLCVEAGIFEKSAHVVGGDASAAAVRVSAEHAHKAQTKFSGIVADGARLPLSDLSVDVVLCNPAWGRAVEAQGELSQQPDLLWKEIGRVLKRDGRAMVITESETAETNHVCHGLRLMGKLRLRVSGRWATLRTLVPDC
jgi:tRNA (guanine6-N2)-methyltransferase